MNKLKFASAALIALSATYAHAGGLLTNTNQNIAFLRNPARDAAIGIDGVYSNPAGVAFLDRGLHLSVNLQSAWQTRSVTTDFAPFAYRESNQGRTTKTFKGNAKAPVVPSLQAAYNTGKWSFQFGFAITGGGGKCVFDKGLPSFESTVAMLPLLSQNLDALTTKLGLGTLGLPTVEGYDMNTYMRGRQYYYGFTLGAARRLNDYWSVYAGVRMLYGSANYYGYVSDIRATIGGQSVKAAETFNSQAALANEAFGKYTEAAAMYQQAGDMANYAKYTKLAGEARVKAAMLSALGGATEDVTLNCDQSGWGVAPILGVDFKTDKVNVAAKYEFRTRMRLKNRAANSASAANLPMLDKYLDGQKVAEDSPALLTLGAQWSVLPQLRVSGGWHHYFDKDATQYSDRQDKLGGDTDEYLFGAEYDVNKMIEVSAGAQITDYDFTDEYMEDVSFNISSWSFGLGLGVKLTKNIKLNVAYFQTNYGNYKRSTNDYNNLSALSGKIVGDVTSSLAGEEAGKAASKLTAALLTAPDTETGKSMLHGSDRFTRTNRVIGIGLDFKF